MSAEPRRQSVTVRIAGEDHVIRSNADPEYTTRCARFVDERIREVREKSRLVEGHKAAILAGLSITDQFFQMQDELEKLRKEVVSRSTNLVRRIEEDQEG
ncbi:MAG: cell division protein ZapA [Gemmatimonadota bacterium]